LKKYVSIDWKILKWKARVVSRN